MSQPPCEPGPAGRETARKQAFVPRQGKRPAWRPRQLRARAQGADRNGFVVFLRAETTGGLLLVGATVAALIWANVAPGFYHTVWSAHAGLGPPWLHLTDLRAADWVADALLAVFFFVVGVELKRELTVGALADRASAALPVAAAAGGMIAPALICLALTHGTPGAGRAWAIPVATDIAFALGVLSLAGPRAPAGLRTVLLGLAVADDLGGILLIAVGFNNGISPGWLAAAATLLATAALAHRRRYTSPLLHVPLAVATWVCVHAAGVHATVAGVALGLLVRARPDPDETEAPATRLERHLGPISAAVVIPVFALSATGVSLAPSALLHAAGDPISRGVAIGLVAGKLLGVPAGAWLAVLLGAARLPDGVRWAHFVPLGLLAGIGYTVSLLLAGLALPDTRVEGASTAILTASVVASALALVALRTPLAAAGDPGARGPGTLAEQAGGRAGPIPRTRRESDGGPAGGEEPPRRAGRRPRRGRPSRPSPTTAPDERGGAPGGPAPATRTRVRRGPRPSPHPR
ncbi:Na+/H+ antiporter NhaA [Frankia sp. QA3]|nr:Na+/H+ antiporter NhaA [Frankia sp. QA3]EIV91203.1 Na+/H+ antiporter NhaA [Frankia sp. QA3]